MGKESTPATPTPGISATLLASTCSVPMTSSRTYSVRCNASPLPKALLTAFLGSGHAPLAFSDDTRRVRPLISVAIVGCLLNQLMVENDLQHLQN